MMRFLAVFIPLMIFARAAGALETPVFNGDARIRAQGDEISGNDRRYSGKLRLRLGAQMKLNPELRAEIRLATGASGRSTNQSLGDSKEPGGARRYIGLDLAYGEWNPLENVRVLVGRAPQFQVKVGSSQMILDDDLALEGAGGVVEHEIGGLVSLRAAGGSHLIRENYDSYYSEKQLDSAINWAQLSSSWKLPADLRLQAGAGFFNFVGVQGRLFTELSSGGSALGNTPTTDDRVQYRYLVREVFGELRWKPASVDFRIFADFVTNPEADAAHDGRWLGFGAGDKILDFQLAYGEVQSDAVVGVFTNSDFADGETDSRGWMTTLRWAFKKNMNARFTYFSNSYRLSTADGRSLNRVFLDLTASF